MTKITRDEERGRIRDCWSLQHI